MGIRDIVDIVKLLPFFLPPSNHRYLVRFNPQSPVEILGIATFIPRKPFSDLWIPAEISHPDFNFSHRGCDSSRFVVADKRGA